MKLTIDKNITYLGIVLLGVAGLVALGSTAFAAIKNAATVGAAVIIEGKAHTTNHNRTIHNHGDVVDGLRFMSALARFESEKATMEAMNNYKGEPTCGCPCENKETAEPTTEG